MTAVKLTSAAALLLMSFVPATAQSLVESYHGVTCDDVRHLSRAEQDYWSEKLHLTPEMRHRIYVACYVKYHGHDAGTVADAVR